MKLLILFFILLPFSVFSQAATKQDIKMLMEQIDKRFEQIQEQNRILREDMNKRFEQVDKRFEDMNKRFEDVNKRFEDVNKRFEDIFRFIGILHGIGFAFLGYLWVEIRRVGKQKYDIAYLEQQIYQAKPEIKARIYLHLKDEAEKYVQKTL